MTGAEMRIAESDTVLDLVAPLRCRMAPHSRLE